MNDNDLAILKHSSKTAASPLGIKVATILSALYGGLHHCDASRLSKVDWANERWMQFTIDNELATYDFDGLTRLVFLAHEHCVRVSLNGCGPNRMRAMFHWREGREGGMSQRHPTIAQVIIDMQPKAELNPSGARA